MDSGADGSKNRQGSSQKSMPKVVIYIDCDPDPDDPPFKSKNPPMSSKSGAPYDSSSNPIEISDDEPPQHRPSKKINLKQPGKLDIGSSSGCSAHKHIKKEVDLEHPTVTKLCVSPRKRPTVVSPACNTEPLARQASKLANHTNIQDAASEKQTKSLRFPKRTSTVSTCNVSKIISSNKVALKKPLSPKVSDDSSTDPDGSNDTDTSSDDANTDPASSLDIPDSFDDASSEPTSSVDVEDMSGNSQSDADIHNIPNQVSDSYGPITMYCLGVDITITKSLWHFLLNTWIQSDQQFPLYATTLVRSHSTSGLFFSKEFSSYLPVGETDMLIKKKGSSEYMSAKMAKYVSERNCITSGWGNFARRYKISCDTLYVFKFHNCGKRSGILSMTVMEPDAN
ncbi:hypothetical protein ACP70R_043114 [Stipagrostis hirtigluma subsp. patula]